MASRIGITTLGGLIDIINQDDECIFVAFIGNNFAYISVNSFVHYLHDRLGYSTVSGVLVNTRTDPNYGHGFADDSYRFPEYCRCTIVHFDVNIDSDYNTLSRISSAVRGWTRTKKNRSSLFFCMEAFSPALWGYFNTHTERAVNYIRLSNSFVVNQTFMRRVQDLWLKISIKAGRIVSIDFRSFDEKMKRNKTVEKYCRIATEDENLHIISENSKYVIYISQSSVYQPYNMIVVGVLERLRKLGYRIYIKPHTHEREQFFPNVDGCIILPREYAIESMVAGASRKPDMIISFSSTSMFSCSAWFDVRCYSLIKFTDDSKVKTAFMRVVDKEIYPKLKYWDQTVNMDHEHN